MHAKCGNMTKQEATAQWDELLNSDATIRDQHGPDGQVRLMIDTASKQTHRRAAGAGAHTVQYWNHEECGARDTRKEGVARTPRRGLRDAHSGAMPASLPPCARRAGRIHLA